MKKQALRGVNLGGWLLLEPWITPSLFEGTEAPDEFTFCDEADNKRFQRLSRHRKTFVTEKDFEWLARQEIEAVRIPVGYWIFGGHPPYVGAIDYLDRAFAWAKKHNIGVLVCLHGAPGSQNGEMHSGYQGKVGWHTDSKNIELSLEVVGKIAQRYNQHPSLLGIELLNEPSRDIPKRTLKDYYRRGYRTVREYCGPKPWVVFSDGFATRRWAWSLHWPFYRQAYQDSHQYQIYAPHDKSLDLVGHVAKTAEVGKLLRQLAWHRKVIIGEWSSALDRQSLHGLDGAALAQAYSRYTQAQLRAYDRSDAWFYWTYRTEDKGPWSFRDSFDDNRIR